MAQGKFLMIRVARYGRAFITLSVALLLVFLLVATSFPLASKATVQSTTQRALEDEAFVLYQNERGEFACRSATKAESDQLVDGRGGGSWVVYEGAPMRKDVNSVGERWKPNVNSPLNLLPSAGLRIVLHGTT